MELTKLEMNLKMICPQDVKVIGGGSDQIKLSWEPPTHKAEPAELYIVPMRGRRGRKHGKK